MIRDEEHEEWLADREAMKNEHAAHHSKPQANPISKAEEDPTKRAPPQWAYEEAGEDDDDPPEAE